MTVEIIQADREAAADFLEGWEPGPEMTVVKLARCFARHRIAHQGKALKKEENMDTFMKPYSDAGHDVGSLFAYPAYKCKICGAAQIDLSEDLMYGDIRPCAPTADKPLPLARCMGGKFCNHQPGTCTATVGQTPTPTVKDSLTGDVDELVERITNLQDGNAWPSTIELINDMADKLTELAAKVENQKNLNETYRSQLDSFLAMKLLAEERALKAEEEVKRLYQSKNNSHFSNKVQGGGK